jgi:hypothetical protein
MTALAIFLLGVVLAALFALAAERRRHRELKADTLAELLRLQQYLRQAEDSERRYRDELLKTQAELAYYRGAQHDTFRRQRAAGPGAGPDLGGLPALDGLEP